MDIEEYKAYTAKGGYLEAGTEAAKMMRPAAVEAPAYYGGDQRRISYA